MRTYPGRPDIVSESILKLCRSNFCHVQQYSGISIGQLSGKAETKPRSGCSIDFLALGTLNITYFDFVTLFVLQSAENRFSHGFRSIFQLS